MGIVGLCIVFNNDLERIMVLEKFGLGECWIYKDCSGSSSGDLPTGQGLGEDYIEEEYDVRGHLVLESG